MICPKCGFETVQETCPSCNVIFAKIHDPKDRPAPPVHSSRKKPFAWDVLIIKILWTGNLIYFNAVSIGVSGEGNFFYAIFNIAMAFPSSLVLIPLGSFFESFRSHSNQSSGNDVASTVALCLVVLVIGYVQWFIIVPRLGRAGWQVLEKVSETNPKTGKWLEKVVGVARIVLRWGGTLYFLGLVSEYIRAVPIALLFLSGAVAVFLAFRPRAPIGARRDEP